MSRQEGVLASRRTVLAGVAGAVATGAAIPQSVAAQTEFGGWLSDTSNFDGSVADRTGEERVSVAVGTQANGGAFGFDPPAVQVDPGTTVVWEWTGEGGEHNVHATSGAEFESETTASGGFTFEHTFEEEGVVEYQCDPHVGLGMKGVVVVGALPGGTGSGDGGQPDWGDWFTADATGGAVSNYNGTTTDRRGEDEVTVRVGTDANGGAFGFGPPALWIDPGTTVRFEWTGEGGGHNVIAESGPADLDSGDLVSEPGVHYEFTFESGGITTYYCDPHLGLGMKGAVAVGDDVPRAPVDTPEPGTGDGGGGERRPLPGGETGSVFLGALFGATALASAAVLGAEVYAWYRSREPAPEPDPATEGPWTGVTEEIGHDEFQPWGTASLVAVYFLILLLMWVFTYFVEFLGNGPTVVG